MQVRCLTDEQIERIHNASIEILDRVGIHLPHPEMLARFSDSDARVDRNSQRVWIPPELVEWALRECGKRFTLFGRDPSRQARFGHGERNYNSIAGEALWLDDLRHPRRYARLDDVITATTIGDALDSITLVGAMADPHEIPPQVRCIEVAATMLKHTTKPIHFWYHDRPSARFLNELMIAVRGTAERAAQFPIWYPFLEPISPLSFPFNGVDILFETAKLNLPVPIGPMAQMGMSAPATVAGTLAQENAEILAGICITQLIRPGMPVCYGGICHAFDMATTQLIFSGPEQAIFGVAMTEIGKHYGLPVYINVGLTDAKCPDAQAGLESGITLMLGAMAGADIFGHMGISGVDQAASLDILVMQDEVIRYVESVLREIDFSSDSLALDEIASVGPRGTFIDTIHTAMHFRRELWFPRLLDRRYYDDWLEDGATSMEQRCVNERKRILATHRPEPISDDLEHAIDDIVSGAKLELL